MKRSGFKPKSRKPLKRTPLRRVSLNNTISVEGQTKKKRKKKSERKKAEEKLWELCKQIIRKKYDMGGYWVCYTSGQPIYDIQNVQTGHGKPKGALPLKYQYDLRNLRPQNFHSNINLGGMQDIFIARLEREEDGLSFLKESCVKEDGEWKIKREPPMGSMQALEFIYQKIEEYQRILGSL